MEVNVLNKDIISAKLAPNQELKFENGLAIAILDIRKRNFCNDVHSYRIATVIQEKQKGEESKPYTLAGDGIRYFSGESFVTDIKRVGDNFFLTILTSDDNVSWDVYKHYKAKKVTSKSYIFDFVREIPSRIVTTSHEGIGILKPDLGKMQLYSISTGKLGRDSYSSIEETEDGNFLVVDTVKSTINNKLRDNLVFLMDKGEYIIGDILSRNDEMKPVEAFLGETYKTIVSRKIDELDNIAKIEMEKIQQLRLGKNKEQ